ncbi:hypothetical protein Avbf_12630 [Armadillidium vulgare]|nr:hypothetical protein Avbf_12630 [Armadillidium vulgare]
MICKPNRMIEGLEGKKLYKNMSLIKSQNKAIVQDLTHIIHMLSLPLQRNGKITLRILLINRVSISMTTEYRFYYRIEEHENM